MTPLAAANIPPARMANKKGVSDWFQVSLTTVDAWARRGCPVVQRGGVGVPWVFDLMQVAQWRFGAEDVPPADFDAEQLMPKERKDWYDSEARRLDVEHRKGRLIAADDFRLHMASVVKSVAQFLETLPDILERDCGLPGEALEHLQQIVDLQRDQLATKLQDVR